ncbi:hypothetical protein [Massilia yuzhufengensis]|jgi:hypothetical protein|uniref:Uncharacterized protein n=1 Tax=Massilia yuzhufengensis TaxID=1164594 RepID=A0A1I1RFS9_9BURK|nr:hypothetical protein [Massilia yuzhufengensis]SFD29280.1 hypothetical protein SAMN05216204_12124 [Massilia yuzhufengensis]
MRNSDIVTGNPASNHDSTRLPAEQLNSSCFCSSLDKSALKSALSCEVHDDKLFELIEERCPYLFSARPVFISSTQADRIEEVVGALESVIELPAYQELVLVDAPDIAKRGAIGARGVFFGYDFHPDGANLGLIEINTNAGGAMLNVAMARAHRTCCLDDTQLAQAVLSGAKFENEIIQMFQSEWASARQTAPLRTIAIVDIQPQQQYLYPEFLLFQRLFATHDINAVIADPGELFFRDGALWFGELQIDLVYNRLTDFMLEAPESRALHDAYCEDAVVLTPHPRAHAIYANKRNLTILSDATALAALGVPQATIDILVANVPFTESVTTNNAERLWNERRNLFFKPVAGYGGRAAYRGDKVTKRVWQEILSGEYIAQRVVAPGVRVSGTADSPETLKFDLRSYVYNSRVQWTAARVYQGQTTNFRTPGGGFAPVYSLGDEEVTAELKAISDAAGSRSCCANDCK